MEPDQRPEMSSALVSNADTSKQANNLKNIPLMHVMTLECFKELSKNVASQKPTDKRRTGNTCSTTELLRRVARRAEARRAKVGAEGWTRTSDHALRRR